MSARNAVAASTSATSSQATGGNFAKIFDIQNKRFITISCRQCGFTELYSSQTDGGMNVLDFLLG